MKNKWVDVDITKGKGFPSWAGKQFFKKLDKTKNRYDKNIKMVFKGKRNMYKAEFIADNSSGCYVYSKKKRNSK